MQQLQRSALLGEAGAVAAASGNRAVLLRLSPRSSTACSPCSWVLKALVACLQCDPAALSDLQSQLKAAQASRSSCTAEAAGLKDKLQEVGAPCASRECMCQSTGAQSRPLLLNSALPPRRRGLRTETVGPAAHPCVLECHPTDLDLITEADSEQLRTCPPQAEASLAANAAALKDLQSKLESAPDSGALEKERAELQVGKL